MSDPELDNYPGRDIPAVKQAVDSGVWKVKKDKGSGKLFFYNPTSKETVWDLAKKLGAPASPTGKKSPPPEKNSESTTKKSFGGKKPATATTAETTATTSSNSANQQPKETPSSNLATSPTTATAAASAASGGGEGFPSSSSSSFSNQQQQQQQQQQNQQQQSAYEGVKLSDPIQRLLEHNKKLVNDIATHEAQSILAGMTSFETRLDLLVHANNVLAVQLDRRNQEALALQRALTESHDTIHKLRNEVKANEDMRSLSYARSSVVQGNVNNEEAKKSITVALETVGRTVVHLQEQNRSLSATIANLTAQLVQNVQASSTARSFDSVSDQPHEWWKNSKGYSVAALTSRFLDSPARNALCPKCLLRISDFRDSLLREVPVNDAEGKIAERALREDGGGGSSSSNHGGGGGGGSQYQNASSHHQSGGGATRTQPQYVAVNAFRGPPPSSSSHHQQSSSSSYRQNSPPHTSSYGSNNTPAAAAGNNNTPRIGGHALFGGGQR